MAARTGSLATALVAGLGLAAAVPGCTAEGSVSLHFDVPDDPALRPGGAASLTLVTQIDADAPRATTTQIGADGQVDLGDLPVADEVWLSAELRSRVSSDWMPSWLSRRSMRSTITCRGWRTIMPTPGRWAAR